jgi:hypothetical protein
MTWIWNCSRGFVESNFNLSTQRILNGKEPADERLVHDNWFEIACSENAPPFERDF